MGDTAKDPSITLNRPPRVHARQHAATARRSLLRTLLVTNDAAAALLAPALVATALPVPWYTASALASLNALAWLGLSAASGSYSLHTLKSWTTGASDLRRLFFNALILSWLLLGTVLLLHAHFRPGTVLLTVSFTALLSCFGRATARALAHATTTCSERVIIIGTDSEAQRVAAKLDRRSDLGQLTLGFIDDAPTRPIGHHRLLCSVAELPARLDDLAIDRAVFAFPMVSDQTLYGALRACRERGVTVDIVPRLWKGLNEPCALDSIAGTPVVSVSGQGITAPGRLVKRAFDLIVAIALLAVLSPILLLSAIAITLESPGGILFKQPRCGRYGEMFELLKFRSMYQDAEERKAHYEAVNDLPDGVMFKLHSDPRITKVGNWLRRFSVDELPQLANVIRGEMSLVGPRPLIPSEHREIGQDWGALRSEVRPGITGLWQISGRSDSTFQEMICFDYHYATQWSLLRDIEILGATLPAVLSGRGAY